MDRKMFEKMLRMMESDNDPDAVMGLRGVQGHFAEKGVALSDALLYADGHAVEIREKTGGVIENAPSPAAAVPAAPTAAISGMPQCRVPAEGHIELVMPGESRGDIIPLPGAAADKALDIAMNFKDAIAAAVVNKAKFRLKLVDVRDARGDIVETVLRAEYDRDGMAPVPIWSHMRGEVAALATVLRRAVAAQMPELAA